MHVFVFVEWSYEIGVVINSCHNHTYIIDFFVNLRKSFFIPFSLSFQ